MSLFLIPYGLEKYIALLLHSSTWSRGLGSLRSSGSTASAAASASQPSPYALACAADAADFLTPSTAKPVRFAAPSQASAWDPERERHAMPHGHADTPSLSSLTYGLAAAGPSLDSCGYAVLDGLLPPCFESLELMFQAS